MQTTIISTMSMMKSLILTALCFVLNANGFSIKKTSSNESIISIPYLIIGGGIHGTHIAACLVGQRNINFNNICIIDNNDELLQSWKERTEATGMHFLRSSAGFHLDLDDESLRKQYNNNKVEKKGKNNRRQHQSNMLFAKDYERPRLDIFNEHCNQVIEKYGLQNMHKQGLATKIIPTEQHIQVNVKIPSENDSNEEITYFAEKVILALGNDEPAFPEWIDMDDVQSGHITHLLDNHERMCEQSSISNSESVAVIGGGISAAHKVLQLSNRRGHDSSSIHLISRHSLREQQFDTNQDYMMTSSAAKRSISNGGYGLPTRQREFMATESFIERREIIKRERISGTITPELYRGNNGLKYAIEDGKVIWNQAQIVKYTKRNEDGDRCYLDLELSNGDLITVNKILLATGFKKGILPGGSLIYNLIDEVKLEVCTNGCGFPLVDENLNWFENRIFVTGALSELEIGPSARNIAGARLAAERIVSAL